MIEDREQRAPEFALRSPLCRRFDHLGAGFISMLQTAARLAPFLNVHHYLTEIGGLPGSARR